MKKGLIIIFLLVGMNVWSQSTWIYDRQWDGLTEYIGSGIDVYEDYADLNNNYMNNLRRIERPSNEQINVIKYGLSQYNVRVNDVYIVFINNDISKIRYVTIVIINKFNSGGGYNISYCLWEDINYRRR